MKKDYLLRDKIAEEIYDKIKDLPIVDYHCHLSPKEILEDKQFTNIGHMWLSGDHYKWRLMRQAGVDEEYITGKADYKDKFIEYARVLSLCGGNPLYNWSAMELSMYFGIDTPLNENTAEEIFIQAQKYIDENKLTPRKLIRKANVKYIATTDDPADTLDFHREIAKDESFGCKVAPAFRPDNILNIHKADYQSYLKRFSENQGVEISSLNDLLGALKKSMDEFKSLGCKFADIGIEGFPSDIYSEEKAEGIFLKVLDNNKITEADRDIFCGFMFGFFAQEFKLRDFTMQLHIAAKRDANTLLTTTAGRDTGSDCMGQEVDINRIINFFDKLTLAHNLPKTIVYSLNPLMNAPLASVLGTYKGVVPGAAWWFCDHKRGILDLMESMAEQSYFGNFLGMLTDSRSFLSYARHDYFRRILASLLAKWVEEDEYEQGMAEVLAVKIAYSNINELI